MTTRATDLPGIPDALPLEYPDGVCRLTIRLDDGDTVQTLIPKGQYEFLVWRRAVLEFCQDETAREGFLSLCGADCADACVLWVNAFLWCHVQQFVGPDGRMTNLFGDDTEWEWNTWVIQDHIIRELYHHIRTGRPLVMDKARQMGATVIIIAVFLWFLMFRRNSHFDVISLKEEAVDDPEDPRSIFYKLDFMLKHLPRWHVRTISRKYLKITNSGTSSSIIGSATVESAGRGGAKTAVLLDEMAWIPKAETIWVGYSKSTPCRIGNSTPNGPVYYSELVQGGGVDVLEMSWYNHPGYGRGRQIVTDNQTGEVYVTSPYYEAQCRENGGRQTLAIAQELDRRHDKGGKTFYDTFHINRHIAAACDPFLTLELGWDGRVDQDIGIVDLCQRGALATMRDIIVNETGRWKLWMNLEKDDGGLPRPPQDRAYVFGIDIAHGAGASNSTILVYCPDEERFVAEWADSYTAPHDLALAAMMAGIWFGGTLGCAHIVPAAIGPGGIFLRTLVDCGYPSIYRRESKGSAKQVQGDQFGFVENVETTNLGHGQLRKALNTDRVSGLSAAALRDLRSMTYYASRFVGPATLEYQTADVRASHGDRGVAAMLAYHGAQHIGLGARPTLSLPKGSVARAMADSGDKKLVEDLLRVPRQLRGRRRV